LGDGPELAEPESGGWPESSPPLGIPVGVTGRVARPGEEDAYRFTATKGDVLVLNARAVGLASPLDLHLRIEDESGKQLAGDDDAGGSHDPQLAWTSPADGVYRVVVGDLNRRGGQDYVYRLTLRWPAPAVTAAAGEHEYRVEPGKTVAIKLTVARQNGHAETLAATVTGLPEGVTAAAAEVPAGGGEVTVTLTAAADAKPAGVPIRVELRGTGPSPTVATAARYDVAKDSGQDLLRQTDVLWLTVLPLPAGP
jgi:hypothetical protein